jgi:hypothetical protein
MGASFSDITLYLPTPHSVDTPEYWEQTSLENFVSYLYVRKMNGYKPPNTSRVTIQPAFNKIWNRTWKNGSIISIAPEFNYEKFEKLDKRGKYQYLLDLIQAAMLQLSDEYKWDRTVFERACKEVIESDFTFKISYPKKMSGDKKKVANLCIEKTETITSVYADIKANASTSKIRLFDKKNVWWYDCAYLLARHSKWFDTDRFGISYGKGKIEIWYSMEKNEVVLFENSNRVTEIDFKKFSLFN